MAMKDTGSKKLGNYLQAPNKELQFIFSKIKRLQELNDKISAYFDATLKNYCQIANIVDKRLVIVVANGSVATQLRFQTSDLLRRFKQDPMLKHIEEIHYKVRPFSPLNMRELKKRPPVQPLTKQTANIIADIADSIEDSKLKEIMKRIAQHVEK